MSKLHRTSAIVTQGSLAEIILCNSGLRNVLSVNARITHMKCLGINFPIARRFATQNIFIRIICVIIAGLIVRLGNSPNGPLRPLCWLALRSWESAKTPPPNSKYCGVQK